MIPSPNCKTCSNPLGRGNRTGYCRKHAAAALSKDETWRAKHKAGIRRSMADPARLEAMRAVALRNSQVPGASEKRSQRAREIRLWEMGHRALADNPEAIIRRGRKRTATVLAHIPPECRADYRHLVRSCGYTAAEASAIILEQHETSLSAWRARIGAPTPPEKTEAGQ